MTEIIRLGTGDLEIEVWTLGARLNGVWFQGVGPLVDGATNEDEARGAKKYNGAVVGPVANRIAGGKASIDGRTHTFERNEKGITTLHSGSTGVHAQEWEVLRRTADRLVMQLVLPDGLGGFPATRSLQADYHVGATGFTTVFTATTDAPTWMNLALHPYWRLSHGGRDNMKMAIAADRYTPVDKDQIPLGTEEDVDRTLFDLRALGVPSDEIDHNFCLSDVTKPDHHVVVEGDLGVRLGIWTDAPGVQVYSGKDIGIAIEPQHYPDAMHHAAFPPIELQPGDTYRQASTYTFSKG